MMQDRVMTRPEFANALYKKHEVTGGLRNSVVSTESRGHVFAVVVRQHKFDDMDDMWAIERMKHQVFGEWPDYGEEP